MFFVRHRFEPIRVTKNVLHQVPDSCTCTFNQFMPGILYFFRSPRTGLFSVKIWKQILAINNFFVNETKSVQLNKRLIH